MGVFILCLVKIGDYYYWFISYVVFFNKLYYCDECDGVYDQEDYEYYLCKGIKCYVCY